MNEQTTNILENIIKTSLENNPQIAIWFLGVITTIFLIVPIYYVCISWQLRNKSKKLQISSDNLQKEFEIAKQAMSHLITKEQWQNEIAIIEKRLADYRETFFKQVIEIEKENISNAYALKETIFQKNSEILDLKRELLKNV